jgi:hypothetical protein
MITDPRTLATIPVDWHILPVCCVPRDCKSAVARRRPIFHTSLLKAHYPDSVRLALQKRLHHTAPVFGVALSEERRVYCGTDGDMSALVILFPVQEHWYENASRKLILASVTALKALFRRHPLCNAAMPLFTPRGIPAEEFAAFMHQAFPGPRLRAAAGRSSDSHSDCTAPLFRSNSHDPKELACGQCMRVVEYSKYHWTIPVQQNSEGFSKESS